jgi:hypothetical protein
MVDSLIRILINYIVGQVNVMKKVMMWMTLCLLGCTNQPIENKHFFRSEAWTKQLWEQAAPVSGSDILGCWISEGSDLPSSDYKSVNYSFSPSGGMLISIIYKNGVRRWGQAFKVSTSKMARC